MKSRIIVCGGRSYSNRARLYQILDAARERLNLGFLIQGGAGEHDDDGNVICGADLLAEEWANDRLVLCWRCEADWDRYDKAAGPIRNRQMLIEGKPDILIAFPGGTGTRNMVNQARAAGVRIIEVDA